MTHIVRRIHRLMRIDKSQALGDGGDGRPARVVREILA